MVLPPASLCKVALKSTILERAMDYDTISLKQQRSVTSDLRIVAAIDAPGVVTGTEPALEAEHKKVWPFFYAHPLAGQESDPRKPSTHAAVVRKRLALNVCGRRIGVRKRGRAHAWEAGNCRRY